MTNEQLVQKFNPANAANLTAEDLEIMRSLTDEQIETLAKAWPNQPTRRSYLRLWDTKLADNKQLFQLSTWQNLNNVRKFSNLKNLHPYDFILAGNRLQSVSKPPAAGGKTKTAPKKVVVDLSAQEAANELKSSLAGDKKTDKAVKSLAAKPVKPAAAKAQKAPDMKVVKEEPLVDNEKQPDDQTIISPE